MVRANEEVESLLQEYADLIAISGGDAFKARAYEKAARAVGGYHADVSKLDAKGLRDIPNVGKSIADKIVEYLQSGRVATIEENRASIPAGVRELITIPTLGPKKAMVLYEELSVTSVDQLLDAIHAERLRDLKGFGEKTEENILHGISLMQKAGGDRILINAAMDIAEQIVAELSRIPGCERCTYAGSLRRMRETIGDIDILVAAERSAPFMEALSGLPYTAEVIAHGEKKTSVRTTKGLQVDLRVLPPVSWGPGSSTSPGPRRTTSGPGRSRYVTSSSSPSTDSSMPRAADGSPRTPRRTSTPGSACPGYRRRCGRTGARSRRDCGAKSPNSSARRTSGETSTPTPTSPTASPHWRTWSQPPRTGGTRTTRSPTTHRTCTCSA